MPVRLAALDDFSRPQMQTLVPPEASRRPSTRLPFRHGLLALLLLLATSIASPARASHDPAQTPTIYVHGFDLASALHDGTYGDEYHEAAADSIANLANLPVAHGSTGPLPRNVVIGVGYYGVDPPSWYSAADIATVDSVTVVCGGGVPRYATIVAKFARRVMARTDASQVNFVSGSFGSLVVRWLIEKNVEGLAGERRIARWLSVEGVLGGNWAASHATGVLDFLALDAIDLQHMTHDWVDAHLHAPHSEADNPLLADILVGQIGSTDERFNNGALSVAMASQRDWQPNDGVQALPDALFQSVTTRSRFTGLPPTRAIFHSTHLGLDQARGAWAAAATFLTQRRRVTITMTSATVFNLHEPDLPFWDWRPAEVVFESRVFSPAVRTRWAIDDPLSEYLEAGGAAPLLRFNRAGDTQSFQNVVFDDFVLPEETALDVALRAYDVDYDPHYGVYETAIAPFLDDLGGGTAAVSTLAPATYDFSAADWRCRMQVTVTEYPFNATLDVRTPRAEAKASLSIAPNPSRGGHRFRLVGQTGDRARVEILDVTGRRVRDLGSVAASGWMWDGCDAAGRRVEPGLYLVRATASKQTVTGRSLIVR